MNVVRMPATCRAPWKKMMHKRAKISGHINARVAEIFLFYIADFICAYPLFIKVT